jgi:HSP20 family protein
LIWINVAGAAERHDATWPAWVGLPHQGITVWSRMLTLSMRCSNCNALSRKASTVIGCGVQPPAWAAFPPINIFQQGDDFIAIAELPGVSKNEIQIQVQDKAIRVSGRKSIGFGEGASLHRRERLSGQFDRTIALPVQIDADRLKAEYQEGLLTLFVPRAESDKPRTIKIG